MFAAGLRRGPTAGEIPIPGCLTLYYPNPRRRFTDVEFRQAGGFLQIRQHLSAHHLD